MSLILTRHIVCFGLKKNVNYTYIIVNNYLIERVPHMKFLCVYTDDDLSLPAYINNLCKSLSSALGLLKTAKYYTFLSTN